MVPFFLCVFCNFFVNVCCLFTLDIFVWKFILAGLKLHSSRRFLLASVDSIKIKPEPLKIKFSSWGFSDNSYYMIIWLEQICKGKFCYLQSVPSLKQATFLVPLFSVATLFLLHHYTDGMSRKASSCDEEGILLYSLI